LRGSWETDPAFVPIRKNPGKTHFWKATPSSLWTLWGSWPSRLPKRRAAARAPAN